MTESSICEGNEPQQGEASGVKAEQGR